MTRHRGGICGHCGRAGHYRPTCPDLDAAREARPARRTPAAPAPSAPAPARLPVREYGPWALLDSDCPLTDGQPMVFTWEHATTGARVTATLPRPPGGWHETTEHLAVLRYPRDPLAYCAKHLPSATVTMVTRAGDPAAPAEVVARPIDTAACGWGMW